ncbi:Gfo/Idh/MocA family protein [Stieleria varia]|uniref:Putative oxidoreductase YcjS n=1 Tax=Stieleria varia TaxID=2528005 RepID=A0A5C6A5T3_9BACT|nr:Gfo/Idh/MocA family oxidoreductase [Stieleria varia]TWT94421.1 putative oxidoreductase YcjS [Stieleria varia]
MKRRSFLAVSTTVMATSVFANPAAQRMRVAIIGDTGRGNYGHGLDSMWLKVPEAEIVAVADPNASGLKKELQKLNVSNGFDDYRQMLQEVRPDVVAVCPRHADQHHDMTLAAIKAGARGIYTEKPFCRTPAEADSILAACRRHNVKLAVAHRNRYHPTLQTIDRLIADGRIGRLLEIRGRGKGDHRGGVEDFWVLGSHVLNLIHYFGGEPRSCSAVLRHNGRPVVKSDVREGGEGLGPMAGDELHVRYEMSSGVIAYFDSIANDGTQGEGFGLQLIGSQGIIAIHCDREPLAHLCLGNPFQTNDQPRQWVAISTAGPGVPEPRKDLNEMIAHHGLPGRDLIESIREDRKPICDAFQGAATVEMICAAFESHRRQGVAVELPCTERGNALNHSAASHAIPSNSAD